MASKPANSFEPYLGTFKGRLYYLGVPEGRVRCADLAQLPAAAQLVELDPPFKNIDLLPRKSHITRLKLSHWQDDWVSLFAKMPNLRQIDLSLLKVPSLPALKPLKSLRVLTLFRLKKLESLEFLRGLSGLHSLGLSEIMAATDLSPLATLKDLRELEIDSAITTMKWIDSLEPLRGLKRLEHLLLACRINPDNRTIRPLGGMKELQYLILSEKQIPAEEKDWLLQRLPKLKAINQGWPGQWPPEE
jgi:hypothetical protein